MSDMLKQNNIKTRIQADGNVNKNTIRNLAKAGATIFTGGTSGLFLSRKSIQENLKELVKPSRRFYELINNSYNNLNYYFVICYFLLK